MSERFDVLFSGGKHVDIRTSKFTIATDQSVKAGGEESSPEPFTLFQASIASCAGIYALNFCQSRDLATEGLRITMLWERDEKQPLKARIRFEVKLPIGFPDKYRQGIIKAMDLCAVKKHIQNPPEFFTEIID